jgi:cell division protein FtsW (lipid II flippase)
MERLEGNPAAKPEVFGEPHLGHATGSEQAFEAVSSIYDVRCGERQVSLQVMLSRERGVELALLAGALLVLGLGWRALSAAGLDLPGSMVGIVTQAGLCVIAMHLVVRVLAPKARPEVLPLVTLLAVIGMVFVVRLAPEAASQQANWLAVGTIALAAGIVAGRLSGRLRSLTYTSGLAAVLILVATGFFGETINGARLWVEIAGQSVQTTELIKAFLVLFLAGYLADSGGALARTSGRLPASWLPGAAYVLPLVMVLAGAIVALALLRDLGSIALLLLLAIAMLYVATGRVAFAATGLGLVFATGVVGYLVFGHVQARVDAWLDPRADPLGSGYQSLQATYAINAGGILGAGLGLGMPTAVPAVSTDYVFVAVAEELGLAGAAGVVLLYVAFLVAGLRVAAEAPGRYERLLAAAIALLIAIQAAVIIAGNLRLIPTTGITLPFVSYGGSSLVVNFGLIGLLLGLSHAVRSRRDS